MPSRSGERSSWVEQVLSGALGSARDQERLVEALDRDDLEGLVALEDDLRGRGLLDSCCRSYQSPDT